MRRLVKLACAAAVAAVLLPGSPAAAHPELTPTLINRYVSVIVAGGRINIVVSLLHGELPAAERRRLMDGDGNGTIDGGELARERTAWARRLDELVRVAIDGRALTLEATASIDLNGEAAVKASPIVIEVGGPAPLASGAHDLAITSGPPLPGQGETEIAIDVGAGWTLLGSGRGAIAEGNPPETKFLFDGEGSGRRSAAIFRLGPGPAGRDGPASVAVSTVLAATAVVGALVAAALGLLLRRRQRRAA